MEKWEIEMLHIYNRPLFNQSQQWKHQTHPAITWLKLTTETLEQGVKYVQS